MADENVKIRIDFDARTGGLRKAMAEMSAFDKRAKALASGREEAFAQRTTRNLQSVTKGWKRSFDFIDAGAKMAGKSLSKFLMLSIKGVIVEMALLGATMVGVHAIFVAGQLVMKAYRGTMQVVAGGAAAFGVALASVSAAIREQQAAIFAYRGKGAPAFGSAMNQTRMAMRNLQMDADLATLGVEALNKAYGNMSKSMNTAQINQSGAAIKALMDFGSAGQDPAKGLEQVSIVIAALSDKKKSISDVITEAKKLGPEMETALKKANIKTKKQFQELLMSGKLAEKGGVSGQFNAINNTLIGQLKSYFTRLRGEFADYGDQFLEPLKVAFEKTFGIIRRDMQRMMATVSYSFGTTGIIDGFSGAIEKTSNWMVRMLREYLPAAKGMFDRLGDWFDRFRRGWNLILDQLRPLIDGARILYKAWDPIWEAIKRGADNLWLFRSLLLDNEDNMVEFGERIAGFIDVMSDFFMGLKRMFADMAPFINDLISGLTQMVGLLTRTLTMFAGGGLASALGPLMGFGVLARTLSGVKGRLMPGMATMSTRTMNVNAGAVYLGNPVGPIAGGATMLGGGPLSSGRVSGAGLSSGATGTAGASAAAGMAGALGAASAYKTSGGNFAKLPSTNFAGLAGDPTTSLRQNILAGSRIPVRGSDIEQRMKERLARRNNIGRGITYALANKITGSNYALTSNPDAMALRVLSGYSKEQLAQTAIWNGVGGSITGNMSRADMINLIRSAPGYDASAFASETPQPTLRAGLSNTMRRTGLGIVGAADRAQYGIRRGVGALRGGMSYLNSGAFNPETGTFYDLGAQRQDIQARYEQSRNLRPGVFGRMSAGMARARDLNRLSRTQSKFGNAFNMKFAKSASGRMGVGMGLGMLSQVAPEEMRGAMALGGTLAQIDPRLGLAVAGVGGAMTARGAGKGALSGAAGGAAIGAMFGPQGALIGAGIGALTGAIMGAVNKGRYELKMAKKAVQESLGRFYMDTMKAANTEFEKNRQLQEKGISIAGRAGALQGAGARFATQQRAMRSALISSAIGVNEFYGQEFRLADALKSGQFDNLEKKQILRDFYKTQAGQTVTAEERAAQLKNPSAAIAEYLKATSPEMQAAFVEIDKVNNERLDALSRATGKSGAELEQIAHTLGVDLYDATVSYDELLGTFTKNIRKNATQMNDALVDIFLAGANPFTKAREATEAQSALNQSMRKAGDILRGGGSKATKQEAVDTALEQSFSQILAVSQGDATRAMRIYSEMFLQGKGKGVFAAGGEFYGMEKFFLNNPLFQQSNKEMRAGAAQQGAEQIAVRLSDMGLAADKGQIQTALMGLSNEEMLNVLDSVGKLYEKTSVAKGGEQDPLKKALAGGSAEEIQRLFGELLGLTGITLREEPKENLDKMVEASGDIAKALEQFNANMKGFFQSQAGKGPDWWERGLVFDGKTLKPPSDTYTPRAGAIGDTTTSKLSQTMSRHAAMDGQLTGKRTVTSSLRNYALGSINSDHVTGSAYDLVGQNLGQYAKLVHANGGFAEFHGTMANRHLHVVPGPGVGDTATVKRTTSSAGGGSAVTNYYNFEINGGNSSPEAIANMVMMKIEAKERSVRERR